MQRGRAAVRRHAGWHPRAPAGGAAPVVVQANLAHRDHLAVTAAVLQKRAQLRQQALRPARVRAKVAAVRWVHAHRAEQAACAPNPPAMSDSGSGRAGCRAGCDRRRLEHPLEGGRCAPTGVQRKAVNGAVNCRALCIGVSGRGERTVCAREVECRARALQRAARDDDALHAGRPAAVQHGRQVRVVVALVTIYAL